MNSNSHWCPYCDTSLHGRRPNYCHECGERLEYCDSCDEPKDAIQSIRSGRSLCEGCICNHCENAESYDYGELSYCEDCEAERGCQVENCGALYYEGEPRWITLDGEDMLACPECWEEFAPPLQQLAEAAE